MAAVWRIAHSFESFNADPLYNLLLSNVCSAGMQPPTVDQAHEQLLGALQDMMSWEARAKTAKDLLNDMLKSRREAAELATQYDIRLVLFFGSSTSCLYNFTECCTAPQRKKQSSHCPAPYSALQVL